MLVRRQRRWSALSHLRANVYCVYWIACDVVSICHATRHAKRVVVSKFSKLISLVDFISVSFLFNRLKEFLTNLYCVLHVLFYILLNSLNLVL